MYTITMTIGTQKLTVHTHHDGLESAKNDPIGYALSKGFLGVFEAEFLRDNDKCVRINPFVRSPRYFLVNFDLHVYKRRLNKLGKFYNAMLKGLVGVVDDSETELYWKSKNVMRCVIKPVDSAENLRAELNITTGKMVVWSRNMSSYYPNSIAWYASDGDFKVSDSSKGKMTFDGSFA